MEEKTGKKCIVPNCGGEIMERLYIPYLTNTPGGRKKCGPASRNIAAEDNKRYNGYHCAKCGNSYYKLPTYQLPEK